MFCNLNRYFFGLAALLLLLLAPAYIYASITPKTGHTPEKSLEFIQNRNQWDASIKYKAALPGGMLLLEQNRWVYSFIDEAALPEHGKPPGEGQKTSGEINAHAYTVTFLNAAAAPELRSERPTPGYRNYFIGNNPTKWASDVKAFEEVQYKALYPGIDAHIYEHHQKLKYDFILQPGADPKQIRMRYDGADKLWLEKGDLVIKTSVNTVTEQKPYAYQLVNGQQQEVPCQFQLKDNVVSFIFPKGYRKKLPLIIDPTLVFSTYSGSRADNWGFTAAYDNAGNIYSGGVVLFNPSTTIIQTFPTTVGAFQITHSGTAEIGLQKFNPNLAGQASLVWSTYLGGNGVEAPHSLVVNSQNELLVLATTSSANFPMLPASSPNASYDNSFNLGSSLHPITPGDTIFNLYYRGGSDIVVTKLSAGGNALMGSTFLGGTGNDGLLPRSSPLVRNYGDQFRGDITLDANDNVYIASSTNSGTFPMVNGFQNAYGGGPSDAVVCKLSPNLSTLLWSTFLGGTGADAAFSIQVDNTGSIYVCGGTTSPNLPQTAGSFKPNFTNGTDAVEGFAAKISNTGTLLRTTYIGASPGYDQTYFLQLDGSNNVYLLGQSLGNYPITPGIFNQNQPSAQGRQFIQKLNSDLTTGIFSLNFGSGTFSPKFNISPTAFLVDNCERIFVAGWGGGTNSTLSGYLGGGTIGLPVAGTAVFPMKSVSDDSDIYLMQLSQNATTLDYAVFLGNGTEHVDGGTSRFDKRGFVYQAVCGGCLGNNNFPTTPNAWSTINGNTLPNAAGNCNSVAFKFDFAVTSAIAGGSQKVCQNAGPTQITGASPPGGTWSGTGVSPGGIFTPAGVPVGSYVLTYTSAVGNCVSTATKTVNVVPEPQVSFSGLNPAYCASDNPVTLIPSRPGGIFSGPGIQNQNQWSPKLAGPGTHIISYTYTDTAGCTTVARDTAFIPTPPVVTAGPNEGACAGSDPFVLAGASPAGGTWSGPGVTAAGLFTPPATPGAQELTYTLVQDNCTYTSKKTVVINPAPNVSVSLQFGNCGTDSITSGYAPLRTAFNNHTTIGESFLWDFGDGTTSTEKEPVHIYEKPGTYTVNLTTNFGRGCIRSSQVGEVKVMKPFLPNIITPNNDNLNDFFDPQVTCQPATLRIFSRWGHLVYERENYNRDFDARNISGGIYYYYLKDIDGRSWKGWLEIVK